MASSPLPSDADALGRNYLPAEVFKLSRDLRTAIDRELSGHGITVQQAALILVARLHGERGLAQLADPLGTDTAGMTRLVDRLEAKGLVSRESSPTDRRTVVIKLTPAGQALVPQLRDAFRRVQEAVLEGMQEPELQQFEATLRRLRDNAQRSRTAAGETRA